MGRSGHGVGYCLLPASAWVGGLMRLPLPLAVLGGVGGLHVARVLWADIRHPLPLHHPTSAAD